MSVWVMADLHLSFGTDKPMDNFFGWKDYVSKIEASWKEQIKPEDTVVSPGDFSWGLGFDEALPDFKFIDALPGRKLVMKGNHDYWWSTRAKAEKFFKENGITTIEILHNNSVLAEGLALCGTRGWINEFGVKTEEERLIKREAQRLELSLEAGMKLKEAHPDAEIVVFMHYPPVFGEFINYDIVDVLYRYGVERVYYGHLHNVRKEQLDDEYIGIKLHLTACDYLGFVPLPVE